MVTSPGSIDLHEPVLWMQARLALYKEVRVSEAVDRTKFYRALGGKIAGAGRTIGVGRIPKLHGATHQLIADRIEFGTFLWAEGLTCSLLSLTSVNSRHLMSVIGKLWTVAATVVSGHLDRLQIVPGRRYQATLVNPPCSGVPIDLQDPFMDLLSLSPDKSMGIETIGEHRCQPVLELSHSGSDLQAIADRAWIRSWSHGVPKCMGIEGTAEGWAALSALVTHSPTLVAGVPQLARGYEQADRSLRRWGACWQCRPLLTADAPAFSNSGGLKSLR